MVGRTLGHYQILEMLGAGGMGEVYRGRDTRLDRDVAIKVLPPAFAQHRERLARFEREARVLASLNHPNVAAIYGLEQSEGAPFLVLELVPGITLSEVLAGGPLKVPEALRIGVQIAEALEAAHDKGIVHRDLKPANVKLTPEGKVKVLDFGLAKVFAGESDLELAGSATLTAGPTREGVILGTAGYMSPEQARGKRVDKRTDVWAFGCVLYESLTGRRAFPGETSAHVLVSVMEGEPDWHALPAATPPAIHALLQRCLHKDTHERLHDIADARIELQEELHEPRASREAAGLAPPRAARRWPAWLWAVTGALAGSVLTGAAWLLWMGRSGAPGPVRRLTIRLPDNEPLALAEWTPLRLGCTTLALSPNGAQLVYVGVRGGVPRLYLRPLDQLEARVLSGTEGAFAPFFSPDGQWIGFFAADKLKKVSVLGGDPIIVCDAREALGATWAADGTIVFDAVPGSVYRVAKAGPRARVEAQPLVIPQPKGARHYGPHFLPDGRTVLFHSSVSDNIDYSQIVAVGLEGGERKVVLGGGTHPQYISSGHLVFARGGSLLAAPFDPVRLQITGPVVPVLPGLRTESLGHAQFSVSRDGTLVYLPGDPEQVSRPVWVDRQGKVRPLGPGPQVYGSLRLSPDGRRLAIIVAGATNELWVYDVGRGAFTRLPLEGSSRFPLWTRDGRWVLHYSAKGAQSGLFRLRGDGSGAEERLTTSEHRQFPESWTPDGKVLTFSTLDPETLLDIWLVRLEGGRRPRAFLRTRFSEWSSACSPDGRWIAYSSNESGEFEVYVRPYVGPSDSETPADAGKWQVSAGGGEEPVWSPSQRGPSLELIYRNRDKWMAVTIRSQPDFHAEPPRLLVQGPFVNVPGQSFDVAPDGRLVVLQGPAQDPAPRHLNVVLNWFQEVRRSALR